MFTRISSGSGGTSSSSPLRPYIFVEASLMASLTSASPNVGGPRAARAAARSSAAFLAASRSARRSWRRRSLAAARACFAAAALACVCFASFSSAVSLRAIAPAAHGRMGIHPLYAASTGVHDDAFAAATLARAIAAVVSSSNLRMASSSPSSESESESESNTLFSSSNCPLVLGGGDGMGTTKSPPMQSNHLESSCRSRSTKRTACAAGRRWLPMGTNTHVPWFMDVRAARSSYGDVPLGQHFSGGVAHTSLRPPSGTTPQWRSRSRSPNSAQMVHPRASSHSSSSGSHPLQLAFALPFPFF
mmetsp:Transcript_6207/g.16074  ORF Transcript_6207/g.16074 Transcript_6207/m.16074 type:complete len:303 (-) Transcript_6207:992-1900(-)